MLQLLLKAMVRITLIEDGFTTGEKVSEKSNPCCCEYPLATNLALYLEIEPSAFFLI